MNKNMKKRKFCLIFFMPFMLIVLILFCPCKYIFALTGGPLTPELGTISTVNLNSGTYVDMPSGDFQYNLPILNVPGRGNLHFTLNLNYKAGIKLNQEASWVGLGWNLTPGAIFRVTPHIPDDYYNGTVKISKKGQGSSYTVGAFGLNYSWGNSSNGSKMQSFGFSSLNAFALSFFFGGEYWTQQYTKTWGAFGFMHFDDPLSKGHWDTSCKMDCSRREYNASRRPGTIPEAIAPPMDIYSVTGPGPSGNFLPTRSSYTLQWENENNISGDAKFFFTDHLGGALSNTSPDHKSAIRIEHHFKQDTPYLNTLDYFIIVDSDGTQYVYGQPAYILKTGYVGRYDKNSDDDESKMELLSPFPYAWYLTAILGPDYVNHNDNTYESESNPSGVAKSLPYPDENDYGNWIRFDYSRHSDNYRFAEPYYGWKETPAINSGSKYTRTWGEKEIIYLSKILTPTHEADFNRSQSLSGWESNAGSDAAGEKRVCEFVNNGGLPDIVCTGGGVVSVSLQKLDSISLYATVPSRAFKGGVSFSYDYSLRPDTPNSASDNGLSLNGGTLTLKGAHLKDTNNSSAMSYGFGYIEANPQGQPYAYSSGKWDKWGYYKRDGSWANHAVTNECTEEYGCDSEAWSLNHIQFPTGGSIHLDYGIDSYLKTDNYTLAWGGGLITRKLTFSDGLGNQSQSEFYYENQNHHLAGYPLLAQTSGTLGTWEPPIYGERDYAYPHYPNPYTNSGVFYRRVWEFPSTGGYVQHDFITGAIGDHSLWDVEGGYPSYTLNQSVSACYDGITDGHCFLYDRSYAWGKPTKKTYYGPTNCWKDPRTGQTTCETGISKEEEYFYNDYHNKQETVFVDHATDLTNFWHIMHYRFWGHLDLREKIEKTDGVEKTIEYVYSPINNKPVNETVSDTSGNSLITTTSFCEPSNNCGLASSGLVGDIIEARNMIALPFSQNIKEQSSSNPQLISYSYNNYSAQSDGETDPGRMRLYHKQKLDWNDTDGDRIPDWSMTPGGPDSYIGVTKQDFDNYGNVLVELDPKGISTTYEYDPTRAYSVITSVTKDGRTTNYNYADPKSNLPTKITQPDGTYKTYSYDTMGRLSGYVSSSGEQEIYTYHYASSSISPSNLNWIRTVKSVNGQARTTKNYSDGLGRNVMKGMYIGGGWILSPRFFDVFGRPEMDFEPFVSSTEDYSKSPSARYSKKTYQIDSLQRPHEYYLSCLDGSCRPEKTTTIFSSEGTSTYKKTITDESNTESIFLTQALNLSNSFIRSGKQTTTVKNLTQSSETVTDASGKTTKIFKDTLGRKIATLRPDMTPFQAISYPWLDQVTEEFVYNVTGNLILFRDSNLYYSYGEELSEHLPKHLEYFYDSTGRQIQRIAKYDSGSEVLGANHNFAYDDYVSDFCSDSSGVHISSPIRNDMPEFAIRAINKLTCMNEGGIKTVVFYDNSGLPGEKHVSYDTGIQRMIFEYYYNQTGELIKETIDPFNRIYAHYIYDIRGNIVYVELSKQDNAPQRVTSLVYLPNGNIETITRTINGVTTSYGYDDLKRLSLINTTGQNFISSLGFKRFYDHDSLGRITKIFNALDDQDPTKLIGDFSSSNSYDDFGRLKKGILKSVIEPSIHENQGFHI